jgi:hypothetical protein
MAIVGGIAARLVGRYWMWGVYALLAAGLAVQTWRAQRLEADAEAAIAALLVEEQRGDAIERLAEEQAAAAAEWRQQAEAAQGRARRAAQEAGAVLDAERRRVDSLGVDAEAMRSWWEGRL